MAKTIRVLLISGHGAGDVGASARINGKTYYEYKETIDVVKRVKKQLSKYGNVVVDLYPTNRNAYEDAKRGCLKVNFANYDYVLEVHFNACVRDLKGNGKTTGTEAFITTYDRTDNTEEFMVDYISDLGLKNRGIKKYNYTVINRAKKASADSSLLEVCFIDDADDMKIYLANKDKIATYIAKAIAKNYGLKKKTTKKTSSESKKVEAKIQPLECASSIKDIQSYLNEYYGTEIKKVIGKLLTVDGLCGNNTKKALAIAFQVQLNKIGAKLTVDGDFGSSSATAFNTYAGSLKKGSNNIFVTLWQMVLFCYGYNPNGIDGEAGTGFVTATNKLFVKYGLKKDSTVNGSDINKVL